jgi:hypothetical protein
MSRLKRLFGSLAGVMMLGLVAGPGLTQEQAVPDPQAPQESASPDDAPSDARQNHDDEADDEFSVGEVPDIQTVELTPDLARRALDTYIMVGEKYKDAELENYETLQDFIDQSARGKEFDADMKARGFSTADEWSVAVATLGVAYSNITENQTDDINQQIEELKSDTELAQDMKDRMIKSLQALIPSANNVKVVEDLIADAAYAEKMKTFSSELEIQRE